RPVRRLPPPGRVRPHARAAEAPRPADGDLRRQRRAGDGRLPGGPARRPAHPRGPQRRRLRRPADLPGALATADDRPPAAGGDGPRRRPHPAPDARRTPAPDPPRGAGHRSACPRLHRTTTIGGAMTEAVPAASANASREPWRDRGLPVAERVADLLARMTPEEKAGQLAGYWAMSAGPGAPVAPMEDDSHETAPALEEIVHRGLGQLTRVFGTAPVPAAEGAARLRELQRRIAAGNRFGIAAIAHEECLNGFMTWGATVFPSPPAWGATFDPELVGEMAAAIGASLRAAGVHQGLAPVLDVVRDARWGRTEESIGEDPYLVGVLGTAYVRGLERSGIVS